MRKSAGLFEDLENEYEDKVNGFAILGTFCRSNLRCCESTATIDVPVYFTGA